MKQRILVICVALSFLTLNVVTSSTVESANIEKINISENSNGKTSILSQEEWYCEETFTNPWYWVKSCSSDSEAENTYAYIDESGEGSIYAQCLVHEDIYKDAAVRARTCPFKWEKEDTRGKFVFEEPSQIKGEVYAKSSKALAKVDMIVREYETAQLLPTENIQETIWQLNGELHSRGGAFDLSLDGMDIEFDLRNGYYYQIEIAAVAITHSYARIDFTDIKFKQVSFYYQDEAPISVNICKPENAIYSDNSKILDYYTPVIFGPIDVLVDTECKNEIERIEFYLDGESKKTDYFNPYRWHWNEKGIMFMNSIEVYAYDSEGNMDTDSKNVLLYINSNSNSFGNEVINDNSILSTKRNNRENKKIEITSEIQNSQQIDIEKLKDSGISLSFDYHFDFGDGTVKTFENIKGFSYTVSHIYQNYGSYDISANIEAKISIDLDCEYDGEYTIDYNAQKTEEIHKCKNKIFNNLFDNILNLLEKILSTNLF